MGISCSIDVPYLVPNFNTVCFFLLIALPWQFVFSIALPVDVTQIRRLTKQAFLIPPRYGTRLQLYRENNSGFSSLVDWRRIVLTHAKALSAVRVLWRKKLHNIYRDSNA